MPYMGGEDRGHSPLLDHIESLLLDALPRPGLPAGLPLLPQAGEEPRPVDPAGPGVVDEAEGGEDALLPGVPHCGHSLQGGAGALGQELLQRLLAAPTMSSATLSATRSRGLRFLVLELLKDICFALIL